jgi:hypothetical protein
MRSLTFLVTLTCAAAFVAAAPAATTGITIGQTSATAGYTCPGEIDVQTSTASGTSFQVPAGRWRITSWSTFAGSAGGQLQLLVFRPGAAPGSFTIVAASTPKTLTPGVLNTFALDDVRVRGGDFLGYWGLGSACATQTGDPADSSPYLSSPTPPSVGDVVAPLEAPGWRSNISATLVRRSTESDGGCSEKSGTTPAAGGNQGDCGRRDNAGWTRDRSDGSR